MNIESTNLKSAASTVAQSLMKVRTYSSPATKTPGGAATTTPNGSSISSNDFLKLLVTEMKIRIRPNPLTLTLTSSNLWV